MNLIAPSAFADNYNIWMFHDGRDAVVLAAILVTHDLAGHADGAHGGTHTSERIEPDRAGDGLPMLLSSTDHARSNGSFSRCGETSAAQVARWKNNSR
jgi:hypothetical protein